MECAFSAAYWNYSPTNLDLDIVQKTTPSEFVEWVIRKFGDSLPKSIVDRFRAHPIDEELAPMLNALEDGDALWLCKSRKMGPLYGHEGVALVRNGRPLIYLRVIDY